MDNSLQSNATDQLDIAGVLTQMVLRKLELVVLQDKDNHNAVNHCPLANKLFFLQQELAELEHLFHNVKLMDLSLQCNATDQLECVGVLTLMELKYLEQEALLDLLFHNVVLFHKQISLPLLANSNKQDHQAQEC